jgi:hypothetical protein
MKANAKTMTVQHDDGRAFEVPIPPATRGARTAQRAKRPRGEEPFTARLQLKLTEGELLAWRRYAAAQSRTLAAVVRGVMARELAANATTTISSPKPRGAR